MSQWLRLSKEWDQFTSDTAPSRIVILTITALSAVGQGMWVAAGLCILLILFDCWCEYRTVPHTGGGS
jgi:hypothetical protein